MAGTLFGLPLSQQMDANGDPLSGCLLYLYEASTSTPVISYADFGLTTANTWPLEADSSGRIPQFWLDDGSYRARLTTAEGVEVFDISVIQALGPSVASSGGGGSGGSTDETSIFATGDMLWKPITGARTGWVRSNARTIGSASSGAVERANADTQALYEYLWNNFTNALCPVTAGRGATAAADFAANKAIGTLDMRGYGIFGLDDMGNSAAGVLVTGTPTIVASSTGAEKTTIATANLPVHTHGPGTLVGFTTDDGAHTHTLDNATNVLHGPDSNDANSGTGTNQYTSSTISVNSSGDHSHDVELNGGVTASTGSGTAVTTISPGRLGTWFIKL